MEILTRFYTWILHRNGHRRAVSTSLRFHILVAMLELAAFLMFFAADWEYVPNDEPFFSPITEYQSYDDLFYATYALYAVLLLLWTFEFIFLSGWRRGVLDFRFLLNLITLVPAVVMLILSLSLGVSWSRVWLPMALRVWSFKMNLDIVLRVLFGETWPRMVAIVDSSLGLLSFMMTCAMVFGVLESYWANLGRTLVESVYFIVITFTAVGYGDVHPTIWQSRVADIIMIVIALYRFPLFFSQVWKAFQLGTGSYRPRVLERTHIIIAGEVSAQQGMLLLNAFHTGVRSYAKFRIIFLTPSELPKSITEKLFNPIIADRVRVIYGDPSSHQDICRTAPAAAQCVIIPNHVATHAEASDTASVLYANAFYSVDPNLPQHVALIRADAVRQLTSGALATLSLSEHLRGVFLGLLVSLPGALAFIMGLTASHDSLIKSKQLKEQTQSVTTDLEQTSVHDVLDSGAKHNPMWIKQLDWSVGNNFFTAKCPPALCGRHFHEAIVAFQPYKVLVIGVICDTLGETMDDSFINDTSDEFQRMFRNSMNEVTRRAFSSVRHHNMQKQPAAAPAGIGTPGGPGDPSDCLPETMTSVTLNPSGYMCHEKTQFVALAQDQTALLKAISRLHIDAKITAIQLSNLYEVYERLEQGEAQLESSTFESFIHSSDINSQMMLKEVPPATPLDGTSSRSTYTDPYDICDFLYYSSDELLPKNITNFILLVDVYPSNTEAGDVSSLFDQRLAVHRARDVHRIIRTIQMYDPTVHIVLLSRGRLNLSYEVRRRKAETKTSSQLRFVDKPPVIHMDGSGSSIEDLLRMRVWEARRILVFSTGDNLTPMGDSAIVSVIKHIYDLQREAVDYLGVMSPSFEDDPFQGFVVAEMANIETLSLIPPRRHSSELRSVGKFGPAFEISLITGHATSCSLVHASLYQSYFNPFIGPVLTALTTPRDGSILQSERIPTDASLSLFIDVMYYYAQREAVALGLHRLIEDPAHPRLDATERFMFVNPPSNTQIRLSDRVLFMAKS